LARLGDDGGEPDVVVADMTAVYATVATTLDVDADALNLEGACIVGGSLRWFHRGLPSAGLLSGSVDLDLAAAVAGVRGEVDPADLTVSRPRRYDLGSANGVGLAITDVVHLPNGDVVASAAAEDSPNVRDDGPVTATALALLRDDLVAAVVRLPEHRGSVLKVEGLTVLEAEAQQATLLAVTDVDDPDAASWTARIRVRP
jgi:hypothetical protein